MMIRNGSTPEVGCFLFFQVVFYGVHIRMSGCDDVGIGTITSI